MKVLHINSNYEQSTIYPKMVSSLINLKVNSRVFYPIYLKTSKTKKFSEFVDVSQCLSKYDKYLFFHRNKKMMCNLSKLYNINSFNISLAYSLFSNGFLAYKLYKRYRIPYVIIVQNTDVNFYFNKIFLLRRIGRKILRNSSKIIFLSPTYKRHVINKYVNESEKTLIEKKSEVIPFGIDRYWIENIYVPKKLDSLKSLDILYVGKVNENKNILTTIKACQELIKKGYNVKFTVIGKAGDEKTSYLINKYEFINLVPFISSKEKLKEFYRSCDVFVMPSLKESFGLVYAEAMSQGTPVIYTKGEGFDENFTDGKVGFSINPLDHKDVANKIIKIIGSYDKISKDCIKNVNKFSWKVIAQEYKRIFNQIIG
ncbi:glycosyltransferase family 4 protein [Thalassobacillus sp. CUG 92003]|uniref:glycosyltransferase family 4 protein n=1 Tax=Thalassobacillus sp. CUG 92003 TaxID=2736641 RepID=UPI0015E64657|nr:glycosyltransferase family 4 protein [Thalassobacillus sp. CUG 92003]